MVDALRRAHLIVRPHGFVLDVHPTAMPAAVEVGSCVVGSVTAGDAPKRHRAATAAVATAVDAGWFRNEDSVEFTFLTYGDTVEELRDYIAEDWRDATIDAATAARAQAALDRQSGVKPRVRERVLIVKLRPV